MEEFWKAAAVLILTVIFSTAIGKTGKDIAVVLNVAACCIVILVALHYLSEVVAFLWELSSQTDQLNTVMGTLLKISGIALMSELTGLISSDAGNSSLGKAMQILGNAAILFLSLPLLESFLTIIQEILGIL